MTQDTVTPAEISAYIDRLLPADRRQAVENHLATNEEARAYAASIEQQNEMIRDALRPIAEQPIPAELVKATTPIPKHWWVGLSKVAALLIVGFITGLLTPPFLHSAPPTNDLLNKARLAYQIYATDQTHPVEYWADDHQGLKKWLAARLENEIEIPSFTAIGFDLIGGRLMMGSEKPAALLIFQAQDGRRMAFYIRQDMPIIKDIAIERIENENLRMVSWQKHQNGYAISGPLTKSEINTASQLASGIFDQLI